MILQDSQQFDIKIQGGSPRDEATGATVSVGKSCWKNNLSSFPDLHLRKGFVPSPDYLSLSDSKGKGSSPIPRRIKFSERIKSVKPSSVVCLYKLQRNKLGEANVRKMRFEGMLSCQNIKYLHITSNNKSLSHSIPSANCRKLFAQTPCNRVKLASQAHHKYCSHFS